MLCCFSISYVLRYLLSNRNDRTQNTPNLIDEYAFVTCISYSLGSVAFFPPSSLIRTLQSYITFFSSAHDFHWCIRTVHTESCIERSLSGIHAQASNHKYMILLWPSKQIPFNAVMIHTRIRIIQSKQSRNGSRTMRVYDIGFFSLICGWTSGKTNYYKRISNYLQKIVDVLQSTLVSGRLLKMHYYNAQFKLCCYAGIYTAVMIDERNISWKSIQMKLSY